MADDGLPLSPGAVSTQWNQVSGPTSVSFVDPTAVDPTVTFSEAGTYVLRLSADDGQLVASDDVTMVVKSGIEVRVNQSSDDAEERISSGKMILTSADLDLGTDAGSSSSYDQIVGLRFPGIEIPPNAVIDRAYLQFRADETDSGSTSFLIKGQAADDATTFTSTKRDISSRTGTQAVVSWSPAAWTKADSEMDQQSADIATIIQEIVNRPGWSTNNAVALLIEGTGERVAEPFDGDVPGFAPLLHVEYSIAPHGVTIIESGESTDVSESGTSDAYQVVLQSQPQAGAIVTINIATSDGQTSTSPSVLNFNEFDWNVPQAVNVTAVDDTLVESSPHVGVITHSASSGDRNYNGVAITNVLANTTDNDLPAPPNLYLSFKSTATLPGDVVAENEDIVAFNGTSFNLLFDGSDFGLSGTSLDGFAVVDENRILLSFRSPESIPGIAGTVQDADIIEFNATQLGDTTAGSFQMFFRGIDAGLSLSSEDIDAFDLHADGRLIVSTSGSFDVPGVTGKDEDLIAFTPATPGNYLSGSWAMYFDGSDVGIGGSDVDGVALAANGDILLSITSTATIDGILREDEDVLVFTPSQLGTNTSGTFSATDFFDGSQFGLSPIDVNGIDLPIAASTSQSRLAYSAANIRQSSTLGSNRKASTPENRELAKQERKIGQTLAEESQTPALKFVDSMPFSKRDSNQRVTARHRLFDPNQRDHLVDEFFKEFSLSLDTLLESTQEVRA